LRASQASRSSVRLTQAQAEILGTKEVAILVGPPGSGKTTALAAFAAGCVERGERPVVVVSHDSSKAAFLQACESIGCDAASMSVGTLCDHVVSWMRAEYVCAQANPLVSVGGAGATRAIVARAAAGLLDMSWPLFARSDVNLDLPYLARPVTFLDEAASLFRLLRRSRVTVLEFEEGCARGLGAFYGEQTERASALLADRALYSTASRRAKDAMRASPNALARQRRAERDVAAILVQLYGEYVRQARGSAWRSPEDLIDGAIEWFDADPAACERVARSIGALIVDDAEDAEPSLAALITRVRAARPMPLLLAGWEGARIDGLAGRRSALAAFPDGRRVTLAPQSVPPPAQSHRFENEAAEIAWLDEAIRSLLGQGLPAETIAVLTRDADAAAHYARALGAAGVPALMPSSRIERPIEMSDLFALAAVVEDPLDQAHLLRVLGSPLCSLSDASIRAMCREPAERQQLRLEIGEELALRSGGTRPAPGTLARNMLDGSVDASLSEAARASVRTLREDLKRWRAACVDKTQAERLVFLARAGGFIERWHGAASFERPRLITDFSRTVAAVVQIEAAQRASPFAEIETLLDEEVVRLEAARPTAGAVCVESIVGCKGQRFDHVFVSGVAHERFPRIYTSHSLAFSRTYGLIVRENVAAGSSQTAKFAWYYARFGAKSLYLDEERRALAYGLTRGTRSATVTGFGQPPRWARDQDLLAAFETASQPEATPA